ncbi:RNA polymerase sigma-70 factor (ECF subfamily) [Bacillus tianshenii]|uniref:RNA polymerase sigma factor n=1 Tax=Sutcliffiella tianshenii TaxID=1463404 RepID=A0ABS2P1W9_9BACI|nr:RNA polymerase sigma factor [Bacillus tianshenii]MBM7620874.1 RNA polymerase sigma-70 factor (ECF subfamily) [Bacillus tianshenii]
MSDKQVISKWFYEYSDDIYQFLHFRLNAKQHDIEDLVQEVFIRALKGLSHFKGNSSPKTWLFSIARNVAIDEGRKRTRDRWKWFLSFDDSHEEPYHKEQTPEEILTDKEGQRDLIAAIRSLKESYKDVLIMRSIKELSIQETAEVLGWSENKVRSTHHRAKAALQKKLGGDHLE